jgi:orotate phosphoribosyltransferase
MKEAVARALLKIGAVGFTPQKPITFKSGIVSPVYVDNRRLPYYPQQWQIVITGFQHCIETAQMQFDVLAGVAVGGVPHSSALGYLMQRPSVFVRKEAKEHGKGQRIEGGEVDGKRVLLIEDLVTTGSSSLSGIEALREAGAVVDTLLAIVSYGFDEARENFEKSNVNLYTLTDFSTILDEALAMNLFTAADESIIRDWFEEPHTWAKRHNKQ